MFPAGYVQRLCYSTGSSCLILNVGLDELRGGVRDGLIRGGGVAIWTRVAHVGVGKHFNLAELVREVHVAVNGRLRTALRVFGMVPIIGYAVSWKKTGYKAACFDLFSFIASIGPVTWTWIALTWSAVCCHVTVTGAIAVIAAVDAAVLVIGTCIWPIVWQPKLVQRFAHAEKARSAIR